MYVCTTRAESGKRAPNAGQDGTPRTSVAAAVAAGDAPPRACCPGSGLPRSELERESAGEVVAVKAEAPASAVVHQQQ